MVVSDSAKRASAALHARRKADGWRKVTSWLTPEAAFKLDAMKAKAGGADAAVNAAILAWNGPGEPQPVVERPKAEPAPKQASAKPKPAKAAPAPKVARPEAMKSDASVSYGYVRPKPGALLEKGEEEVTDITEAHARRTVADHAELVAQAIHLVRRYGNAICLDGYYSGDFSPSDENAVRLDIADDVATLSFTADTYDAYASSLTFDARCLWSRSAIAAAIKANRQANREARAAAAAQKEARERQQYEALRRRFESTDLRSDLRRAMEIETVIAAEDAP